MGGSSPHRLSGLDQLRGAAALLVLFYHLDTEFGGLPLFSRSYLAVDFFFMLSGFVMARTYEGRFTSGTLGPARFLTMRFRRLWGPIAIGMGIGFVALTYQGQAMLGLTALVPGLLLLPNLALERPYLLNRPAWSIFFELAANLIHGAVLHRLRVGSLLIVSLMLAAFLLWYCASMGGIFVGFRSHDFAMGIPRVLLSYCIGIALFRTELVDLTNPNVALVGLIGALLFLPAGIFWDIGFVLLVCPVIILLGKSANATWPGQLAGAASFPLYAVHMPVIELAKALGFAVWTAAGVSILLALAVTSLFNVKPKPSALESADKLRIRIEGP